MLVGSCRHVSWWFGMPTFLMPHKSSPCSPSRDLLGGNYPLSGELSHSFSSWQPPCQEGADSPVAGLKMAEGGEDGAVPPAVHWWEIKRLRSLLHCCSSDALLQLRVATCLNCHPVMSHPFMANAEVQSVAAETCLRYWPVM